MKKFKLIALMMVLILTMQSAACAAPLGTASENETMVASVQPRGRYLLGGSCTITPGAECVTVGGQTESYDYVDRLTITLTVYKRLASGAYLEVWSDSVTGYDDYEVGFPNTTISVDPGYYYMVEATHTVKHGNVTERNTSEAGDVYVWYK